MSSDEGEVEGYEKDLFADEAEVSGSDRRDSGDDRSGDERNGIQSGSGEDTKDSKKDKKVKPKVKKPQGKRLLLNEEVLCGKNGLIKIEEIFKDFKFEGRGREKQDLDRLLHKIEMWVHVMHPRNPFDQALERIEWLGLKKKSVKTHVKKIRMGLITNIQPANDNMPDFGNSDDEGNMEGVQPTTNAADEDLDTPARPVQIQHFGFDDSDDEDDLLFASMVDPSTSASASDTQANKDNIRETSNEFSDSNIEDLNMDIEAEFNTPAPVVVHSWVSQQKESDSETEIGDDDEGRLVIDTSKPLNLVSNISEEIEDMMLDEESQIISHNEEMKKVEVTDQKDKVVMVDDDEFDRLMAEVGM